MIMLRKSLILLLAMPVAIACRKDNPPVSEPLYFPPSGSETWETISPSSLGWNTAEIPALLTLLETNGTRGFILLKDGKIVMEEYFGQNIAATGPFTRSSIWYWASAGKTLTAFIAGKASEEGLL